MATLHLLQPSRSLQQDAISKLAGAKTVDELVKAWKDLPVDLKQVEDVEALKNIRKAELTTK